MSNVFGNQMFSRQNEYGNANAAGGTSNASSSSNTKPATNAAPTSNPPVVPASAVGVNNTRPISTSMPRPTVPITSAPPRPIVTPAVNVSPRPNPVSNVAPAPAPAPVAAAPRPPAAPMPAPTSRPPAPPVNSTSAPRPTVPASATNSKQILKVSIVKSEHGIGLDIAKTPEGGTMVQKLKEMPPGVANPALACKPAILPGDIIIEVNGEKSDTFATTVKYIRASEGTVTLTLERNSK